MCLLLAKFLKKEKWRKRSLTAGILLLLLFSNEYLSNLAMFAWEERTIKVKEIQQPYDIGIVLGGYSKSTNRLLNDNRLLYLNSGANRLTQAIELYKLGKIKKFLLTGGNGEVLNKGIAESINTKQFLIRLGVPTADILMETKSRNTHENALFSKEILKTATQEKDLNLLLITSAFHMYRAEKCFKKVGLITTPFSVDFHARNRFVFQPSDLVPSPKAIEDWQLLIKELVGTGVYWLRGYI